MTIPTIDLSRFRDGTPEQRTAVAAQVDEAARTVGFMQVVGHAIPAEVEAGLIAAMDGFFGLPMVQKKALQPASVDFNRGYTPPKSERLTLNLVESAASDLFEAFNVGRSAEDFPGLDLDDLHYAPNLWPLRPASFEPGVQAWFDQAARVAREITTVMAVALGLDEHFFADYQDHSLEVLRMNNYRVPSAAAAALELGQAGMGAHTDDGIVTVLWAEPIRGLQILNSAGTWQDVVPVEGALLVNLGDLLARWTNDRWISPLHQVLPPTDAEGRLVRRRSAAFFHDGNADAMISCLPGCATEDHPARYEPVLVADYLTAKLNASRELIANSGVA